MDNNTNIQSGLPSKENLRWLFILRNLMIGAESLIVLISVYGLNIPLKQESLWPVICAIGAFNVYTWLRLETNTPVSEVEIFSQLVLDVFGLAVLLYLTGGATNPIIWIFLLPLILTSIMLPQDYTWYMVILTTSLYTILIPYHTPLPAIEPHFDHSKMSQEMPLMPDDHFFNLHIFGMWFGFIFSAGLVAYFTVELAQTIRDNERNLADARENALRDERIVALGTLAASAAHDMSTPLGTISIIIHEIQAEYPEHRFPDIHEKLHILKQQIERCKKALTLMSASAGELRAESGVIMPLPEYLDKILNQWRAKQPGIKLNIQIDQKIPINAKVIAEQTLTHSLINILNNAAEVTSKEKGIEFHISATEEFFNIQIRDFGPGIPPEIIASLGKQPVPSKKQGLGVGLFLTYTTITRLGGKIDVYNMETGGACFEIALPLLVNEDEHDRSNDSQTEIITR
jgi:two-component system sensor histidine kinase RegB